MYVTTEVDVDIDEVLREVDTDVLADELERRGYDYNTQFVDSDVAREKLVKIWELRRLGRDYDEAVGDLIYYVLGKVI